MQKKIAVVAMGAAVSVGAMTGCAATKTAAGIAMSPLAAVQAAFTKTSGADSVKVDGNIVTSGGTVKMSGVEEFSPLKISMSLSENFAGSPAMSMSMVYDGTNFYVQEPELASLDSGKPWAQIDMSSLGADGGSLQSLINGTKNESPSTEMEPLLASGDLKNLGAATVDGTQTTHYSGTLTAAQVASAVPTQGLSAAEVQQIKQYVQESGETSEKIDVWIDSADLPVQMTDVATLSSGVSTTTMDFSDWGAPVSITDPPASQVGRLNLPSS